MIGPQRTIRLTLVYEGTRYSGWQVQPGRSTVQGALAEAIRGVTGETILPRGSSRTDAGVHAIGQVAAFTSDTRIPIDRLAMAINSRLPDDVRVRSAELSHPGFDPISDCVSKCYRYSMSHGDHGTDGPLLFERRHVWTTWYDLDAQRMRDAAAALVGTHDFAAFAQVNHGRESTVRTIHGCTVLAPAPGRAIVEVAGNGFLYNMVRIIAGTLVEVGRGRIDASHVRHALQTGDRTVTGPTLPPNGLRLEWVRYGPAPTEAGAE